MSSKNRADYCCSGTCDEITKMKLSKAMAGGMTMRWNRGDVWDAEEEPGSINSQNGKQYWPEPFGYADFTDFIVIDQDKLVD